jgi:hypothetical protein
MEYKDLGVASGASARPQLEAGVAAKPSISFALGAVAKPLKDQFLAQDLLLNPNVVALWQARMEAISTLRLGDVLTWTQAQRAYDRLGKQILASLESGACAAVKASQDIADKREGASAPSHNKTSDHIRTGEK